MVETNQNSQTSLDFNIEKFEPKNESEIQQIIKYCFKKNLPIEIVGSQTKQGIGTVSYTHLTLPTIYSV